MDLTDGTVSTSGLFNNMYLKLREVLPLANKKGSEYGWKVHLQDAKHSPVLEVLSHGFTLLPGWNKDIRLGLRDVSYYLNANTRILPYWPCYHIYTCETFIFSSLLVGERFE